MLKGSHHLEQSESGWKTIYLHPLRMVSVKSIKDHLKCEDALFSFMFFHKFLHIEAIPPHLWAKTVLQPSPYCTTYCSDLTYLLKTPYGKDTVAGGDTAI